MTLKLLTFKTLHHLAPTAFQPPFIFFFLVPISSTSQASFLFLEGFVCISCSLSLGYFLLSPSYRSDLTTISPPQRSLSWPPSVKELSIPFLSQNTILILCTTLNHYLIFQHIWLSGKLSSTMSHHTQHNFNIQMGDLANHAGLSVPYTAQLQGPFPSLCLNHTLPLSQQTQSLLHLLQTLSTV